jgi:ATP phosphoribosyltransferase
LVIAVPNKGRVKEPSFRLLEEVGIKANLADERRLILPTSRQGVSVLLVRSMDIPLMVERGVADIGIAGQDAIAERGSKVEELVPLDFGSCKVALAAPRNVRIPKAIATALPRITERYCKGKHLKADIVELQGALESAPLLGIADSIVDQVATGTTLRENKLRILDVIMETRIFLIGNRISMKQKSAQIDQIALCVQGVLEAKKRMYLRLNAATDEIRDRIAGILPAMRSPDISDLVDGGYVLAAAVPKKGIEDLVVRLKAAGGSDIIVEQLKMIIP